MLNDVSVVVKTLFGARERRPFVHIQIGDFEQQWEAGEARRIGLMLIEAASASETDAFVFRWLQERIGIKDERKAAEVLRYFRELRAREPSAITKTWPEILEGM